MVIDSERAARPDRLIHVGPHKTGTTTVQAAFHHNRRALLEAGVLYLGDQLQPTTAVKALTGAAQGATRTRGLREWDSLVAEATSSQGSVVLSSEFLCEADAAVARRVVAELGRSAQQPPHIVVTLRPLAKILPSQWQQFVQSGTENTLEEWIEWALQTYGDDPPPPVWLRHRHHDVVARWAEAAGSDNVTVIVADDSRPRFLPQIFERLLGLPEDTLVPPVPVANRSLTVEEAECVRLINLAYREARSRQGSARRKSGMPNLSMDQRMAIWRALKRTTPDPLYHKVALPSSTVDRVRELASEIVKAIETLDVHVVGDLSALTTVDEGLPAEVLHVRDVRPQLVADVATALLTHATPRNEVPTEVASRLHDEVTPRWVPATLSRWLGRTSSS